MTFRSAAAIAALVQVLGLWSTMASAALVAPDPLVPGASVSPLPNGPSTGDTPPVYRPYDATVSFAFANGPSGTLRSRVIGYADVVTSAHPYGGGLYFDYEITLTSGDIAEFVAPGYASFTTSVKECGIAGCGGSGALGVLATGASRSVDGADITFYFSGDDLVAGSHSANLQVLTDASAFVDPLATFIDTAGDVFTLPVVAPAVPENATWALMAFGLLALRGLRKSGLPASGDRAQQAS